MRRALVIAVAMLQVVVLPARAAEFVPSWDVEGRWDSNVFKSEQDQTSDFSVRTGPTLQLREMQGDLTYDLNYQYRYEAYANQTELNGLNDADQFLTGVGSWRVTPTTTITADDSFAYTTNISSLFNTGNNALVSTVSIGRERVTTNSGNLSLTRSLGPLWELTASAGNQFYDYKNPAQSDTTATTGTLQLTRGFSPRLVAGVGTQYQRQKFAEVDNFPSRGTSLFQGFGVMNYKISPTWRISARAGPALVKPDPLKIGDVAVRAYYAVDPGTCPRRADGTPVLSETCSAAFFTFGGVPVAQVAPTSAIVTVPFVGQEDAGSSLNYFGRISMDKYWREWRLNLDYSRSASNSSGLNGSSVLDQFTGSLNWTPSPLWSVTFNAIYSRQTALNKQRQQQVALQPETVNSGVLTTTIGIPFEVSPGQEISSQLALNTVYFTLSANRRVSRQLTLVGTVGYWEQRTKGSVQQDTQLRDVQVSVGFTWNFDPIPL